MQPLHRGEVVAGDHFLGQRAEPVQHGGHHEGRGDLLVLDAAQGLLRVEAPLDDHGAAQDVGDESEDGRRRVVERAGEQVSVRRRVAEGADDPDHQLGDLRAHGGVARIAEGALGPTGGAGRVDDGAAGRAAQGQEALAGTLIQGFLERERLGQVTAPFHIVAHHHEAVLGNARHLGQRAGQPFGEDVLADERLGIRVVGDVGGFGAGQPVAHRDAHAADLLERVVDDVELGPVVEHPGDAIAFLEPEAVAQEGPQAAGVILPVVPGEAVLVVDESQALGIGSDVGVVASGGGGLIGHGDS